MEKKRDRGQKQNRAHHSGRIRIKKKIPGRRKRRLFFAFLFTLPILLILCFAGHRLRTTYRGPQAESPFPMSDLTQSGFSYNEHGLLRYEDDHISSKAGIDISTYQREVDWDAVRDGGVEFVYLRLGFSSYTDGSSHLDAKFRDHFAGARGAGLPVGVYFFSQAVSVEEAIEEARFVMHHVSRFELDLPVAFDMEPVVNHGRIQNLSMEEKTLIADAFCSILEQNGYETLIYGNPDWIYQSLNLSMLSHRQLWLAHYTDQAVFPYRYTMWQYSSTGSIPGIEGNVDLDILFER